MGEVLLYEGKVGGGEAGLVHSLEGVDEGDKRDVEVGLKGRLLYEGAKDDLVV